MISPERVRDPKNAAQAPLECLTKCSCSPLSSTPRSKSAAAYKYSYTDATKKKIGLASEDDLMGRRMKGLTRHLVGCDGAMPSRPGGFSVCVFCLVLSFPGI
jgi:hypothetical protein